MKQNLVYISLLFIMFFTETNAQITNTTNTVGLLYSEPEKVSDGYLLFAPLGSQQAFLIDNCGLVVNEWTFDKISTYSGCYLLEDGSVLKLTTPYPYAEESCVERRSWDDQLMLQYCVNREIGVFHSDMHILPNGNILVLMLESFTVEEAILSGINPSLIDNEFSLESVLELKPIGIDSAEIVWQWSLKDHLIQEHDASKNNYGIVKDHPRRYNANLYDGFNHFNSIDYNETLDQIVVSSWRDHEIYIIDHSTTTEEAADSIGGKYGHGGDYLFRWGNPANYGIEKEQRLLGQHNPRWIPDNYSRFGGMMSVFNNRYKELLDGSGSKSAAVIINPDPDGDGVYEIENNSFLPESYEYVLPNEGKVRGAMYSEIMSGTVVQANGNIITCEAERGRFTEFDEDGEVVWMYQCPVEYGDIATMQGSRVDAQVYKVEKYLADYPGLQGRDLCGKNNIENENTLSDECAQFWTPNMAFLFAIDGAKVDFTVSAQNPDNVMWDFGDGNTVTEDNPTHIFEMPNTYEVCVSGSNCFGSDTYCKSIEITVTSIEEHTFNKNILQTNLVKDQLIFTPNTFENLKVFNELGMKVMDIKTAQNSVSSNHLPAGVYFLQANYFKTINYKVERFIKL